MGLSAVPDRPLSWPRRFVSWIFALATSGYRIRLEFSDHEVCEIGPATERLAVTIRPPNVWRTIWIFLRPGLRAGEGFMRGYWAVNYGDLTKFLRIVQTPRDHVYFRIYRTISNWRGPIFQIRQRLLPVWNRRKNAKHYNVGNELYGRMLDSSAQYSCAFFSLSENDNLEAAQEAKLKTSIDRLHLDRPNLSVLDIGCGFGALAARIALLPGGGHHVWGITLSSEQLKEAQSRTGCLPASVRHRLTYLLADYRDFLKQSNTFDRIISIGMFEHVGLGRHRNFFKAIEKNLAANGRALIHSIIGPFPGSYNEWIRRYIFPGSFLPSSAEIIAAAEKANLIVDAFHIHPPSDYRKTIQAWRERFETAWPEIHRENPQKYDQKFRRMWTFYLAGVETIFSEDLMNYRIAQIELRKTPSQDCRSVGECDHQL